MQIDVEERSARAVDFFKDGYNCAQSVYMAFADIFGLDIDLAAKIIAPLGGGMGRLREVCGAVSGMFLVAGLHVPANDPRNREMKIKNYSAVQYLANEFTSQNGSIICRELLGLDVKKECPIPEQRTKSYYAKRPCVEYVRMAATIVGEAIRDGKI